MLITTRLATFQDIIALNKLIDQSVRGLSTEYYTPAQIDSALKYVFGVDTQLLTDGTYFVAEVDGVTAGCGGWSKRNTLFGGDQHKGGGGGRLRTLCLILHLMLQGSGHFLYTLILHGVALAGTSSMFVKLLPKIMDLKVLN